jgi:hypothetical protein
MDGLVKAVDLYIPVFKAFEIIEGDLFGTDFPQDEIDIEENNLYISRRVLAEIGWGDLLKSLGKFISHFLGIADHCIRFPFRRAAFSQKDRTPRLGERTPVSQILKSCPSVSEPCPLVLSSSMA